jgi:hypothetical protein
MDGLAGVHGVFFLGGTGLGWAGLGVCIFYFICIRELQLCVLFETDARERVMKI